MVAIAEKKVADQVTAQLETIGPKEARHFLRLNTHNRNIRATHVTSLARDMAAGRWFVNGETIKISKTDRVLDGQHRLLAIVESGAVVASLVIRGLDDEAQETVDIGAKRMMADVLQLRGEADTRTLSGAVRFAWFIDNFGEPAARSRVTPSLEELLEWLERNPGIRNVPRPRNLLRYHGSVEVALRYLMYRVHYEDAERFWDQLASGQVEKTSPIYVLRQAIIRDLGMPHRMSADYKAAITIKAWNYWRAERKIQQISWKRDGGEPFPRINGRE